MLFDLALGGHHGNYIQHQIDRAYQQGFRGAIDIVVLPEFASVHQDTVAAIDRAQQPQLEIQLVAISAAEATGLGSRNSGLTRARRNFREWQLFCKYAEALHTTHALIMYLDTCELPLAMGMRSPCAFSGIYFRPTVHYQMFANYQPNRKDKLQQWRERLTWARILKHPQLETVFCLDPFAVTALAAQHPHTKVVHLADPVQPYPAKSDDLTALKTQLGIAAERQVFLLFGGVDGRKGIYQLLEAISLLPPAVCKQFCLLLVGQPHPTDRVNIHQKITALCETKLIQAIEHYEFIPEADVPTYFQLADAILAPYQRHVGMSGILLLAAAAGKPVLSSDYGLMGELARQYQLGLVVDSTQPTEIAKALTTLMSVSPHTISNSSQMQLFAAQNSIDLYASTIFAHLPIEHGIS
ncbi:glycosyltransferase [Chamaesiphon sp. VAR_69_metabat_338]|uniref:glycosyltransferase n=1 Tax=Chamaesiphon sp. VAR_69_metabat_338 TaxID=2964704 RepID=UPI00286D71E2|nr:glycosyltransferase [Chamaesiphon sp. VAR_69_metabat_338]